MQIDKLAQSAGRYAQEVGALALRLAKIEERLTAVNQLDQRATEQIARLDAVLDEKTKTYNLKELQTALESYNKDVKRVGDFINKDVADTLFDSRKKLDEIKGGLDGIVKRQTDESQTLDRLLGSFSASSDFLKKIAEKQDVNEAYLFDILDRWAEDRRIKVKK